MQLRHYSMAIISTAIETRNSKHRNSMILMDIYAKVKYNKPKELAAGQTKTPAPGRQ